MNPVERLKTLEASIVTLTDKIQHLNQRKADISTESKLLKLKIDKPPHNSHAQKLLPDLKLLKDLERQGCDYESKREAECLKLEYEINELEKILNNVDDEVGVADVIDHYISETGEKLNQAKEGLTTKYRAILLLKRQLDDMTSQGELIQYERRLSELYTHIQGKLRQTRQCYATYNTLLEIKDLMLKETSLLNSISSQFHNAISSPSGRAQLVGSMQGILQGSQQKLKKIQLDLQAEQKVHGTLKEKYAASLSEQRLCKSLLQDFQDECAKNEQLRGLAPQPCT